MAHVGVERFGAGDGEHHGAEREEAQHGLVDNELRGIERTNRLQHFGRSADINDSRDGERRKPQAHHRAEHQADRARPMSLNGEKAGQDQGGDRHHIRSQFGRDHFEPFDRAQHRNRRRDHAVAVEQGGGEYAEQRQGISDAVAAGQFGDEREQGKAAAFAVIVCSHDDENILDRDQQHHGPEHQREHAEDIGGRHRHRMVAGEGLLDGVERTSADVPVDDAEGGDEQARQLVLLFAHPASGPGLRSCMSERAIAQPSALMWVKVASGSSAIRSNIFRREGPETQRP